MTEYQVSTPYPRVLSIQSTVVYGYVGNKASVYGLQARQIEVDPLMTCQFSNHTGYDIWKGCKINGTTLTDTIDGLEQNQLLSQYTHILSGYIAEQSFIESLPNVINKVKTSRYNYCHNINQTVQDSNVIYLCDPVLGDNGTLYVPETFLKIYQDELIPLADIVTPNETELKLLANMDSINSISDIQKACDIVHQLGPRLIIITSMNDYLNNNNDIQSNNNDDNTTIPYSIEVCQNTNEFYTRKSIGYPTSFTPTISTQQPQQKINTKNHSPSQYNYNTPSCLLSTVEQGLIPQSTLGCFISYIDPNTKQSIQYYIKIPRFKGYIVGTGDLTASLILAHLQQISNDNDMNLSGLLHGNINEIDNTNTNNNNNNPISFIVEAICRALSTIHIVVRATIIRGLVGKHCSTCQKCLSCQNLKKTITINTETNTNTTNTNTIDNQTNTTNITTNELPQAPIVANLITEPLELWLTGTHHEFLQPTCTFTPYKIQ